MLLRPASVVAALLLLSPAVAVVVAEADVLDLAREVQPEALHAELHGYTEKFQHVELAKRQSPPNNATSSDPPTSSPPPSRTTRLPPPTSTSDGGDDNSVSDEPTPTPSTDGEPTFAEPEQTAEESSDEPPSSTIRSTVTEPEPSTTDEPDVTPEPTTTRRPANTSTSSADQEEDDTTTTSSSRRRPSTSLSTSRRTLTVNGERSTMVSVVVVTPTETADLPEETGADPTGGGAADLQDNSGVTNRLDTTLLAGAAVWFAALWL